MHITQALATRQHRLGEIGLFDIHVVGVQMHHHVGCSNPVDQIQCLQGRVDLIVFVPVDDFQAQRDVALQSQLGDLLQAAGCIRTAGWAEWTRVFRHGTVQNSTEIVATQGSGDVDPFFQDGHATGHAGGVFAGNIGVQREAAGATELQPVFLRQIAGQRQVHHLGAVQGQLDHIKPCPARLRHDHPRRFRAQVAGPDQRMYAQRILMHGAYSRLVWRIRMAPGAMFRCWRSNSTMISNSTYSAPS